KEENKAALNFHLTKQEENEIMQSVNSQHNLQSFRRLENIFLKEKPPVPLTPVETRKNFFPLW
ncbi:MAG TPA: hypothetical protein PLG88_05125, partial [Chitinophagaceae bacterium]|nr:hypothetical protein [Chitinophagaceae bacterium]